MVALVTAALALAAWLRFVAYNRHHPSFGRLYARAVGDVIDALEAEGAEWWFTEGTLIACLRYGANTADDVRDVVDDDIDVMVRVRDQPDWLALSTRISDRLRAKGWGAPTRRSTSRRPGARVDKLQQRLRGLPLQRTHVDLHSYVETPRGLETTGDPAAWPFQAWGGAMPPELVTPLEVAGCHGRTVPCPRAPEAVLGRWNAGEYADGPLALPPRALSAPERAALRAHALRLDALGFASFAAWWRDAGGESAR